MFNLLSELSKWGLKVAFFLTRFSLQLATFIWAADLANVTSAYNFIYMTLAIWHILYMARYKLNMSRQLVTTILLPTVDRCNVRPYQTPLNNPYWATFNSFSVYTDQFSCFAILSKILSVALASYRSIKRSCMARTGSHVPESVVPVV